MTTGSMSAMVARPVAAGRTWATDLRLGGLLFTLAGAVIVLGIISAEALYPAAYSTGANEISDLGGTRPPEGIVLQPSAAIFDGSMIIVGLLVVAGSWFVQRAFGRRSVTMPLAILGAAAFGVGVFPGNTGAPHAICAMVTFVAGGVAAIAAAQVVRGPFGVLSIALGSIALLTLVSYLLLGDASPMARLGVGGLERWIVYPVVIWVVAFGGYLSGRADGETATPDTAKASAVAEAS
jgi:hypothetical membrane protein